MNNRLTVSDELGFWELHLPRPLGYQPPPEPEPAPVREPDVAEMSVAEYAQNRERLGIPDTGDIVGTRPWRRPVSQQVNE